MTSVNEILWKYRARHAISTSLGYFIQHRERLFSNDYTPSVHDLMRMAIITTGSNEATILYRGDPLKLIDTGGQRSERTKWLNLMFDANLIIFTVSLSDFDQDLYEDIDFRRAKDAFECFKKLVESYAGRYMGEQVYLAVAFTKKDILRENVETFISRKENLQKYFPKVKFTSNLDENVICIEKYMVSQYLEVIEEKLKSSFVGHFSISVLDTEEVTTCAETLLRKYLTQCLAT